MTVRLAATATMSITGGSGGGSFLAAAAPSLLMLLLLLGACLPGFSLLDDDMALMRCRRIRRSLTRHSLAAAARRPKRDVTARLRRRHGASLQEKSDSGSGRCR